MRSADKNQSSRRWRRAEDYLPTAASEVTDGDDRRNSQEAFEHAIARELAGDCC